MLERACHACDLCAPVTDLLSNRLPCPGDVGQLPNQVLSLFHRQAEKLHRIFKEANLTRPLIEIDVPAQENVSLKKSVYRPDRASENHLQRPLFTLLLLLMAPLVSLIA